MWELDYKEIWVPKNWCFWTMVLEKTLESPLDNTRSSQSILKKISPEYSLEGLTLKLKLQYFGYLMQRTDSFERPWCWERLKAGEGDDRGWDGWVASLTRWTWVWASSRRWWRTGKPDELQSMGSQRVGHDWTTELTDWWCFSQRAFYRPACTNFSITFIFENHLFRKNLLLKKLSFLKYSSTILFCSKPLYSSTSPTHNVNP